MIFGKDKGEFDFNAFKSDVTSASEPLVEAVNKYNPNKKKRNYKTSTANLHESASLFFQAAADTLDKKNAGSNHSNSQDNGNNGFNLGDNVKNLKLDKKAQQAGQKAQDVVGEAGKRAGWLFGAAGDAVGGAQDSLKDAKLDKKLGKLTDDAGKQFKNARLDKKVGKLVDDAGSQFKDLKLEKKWGKFADNAGSQVKDLKLDKKAGDVAGTVGGVFAAAAGTVGDAVNNAHLDKRFSDVAGTIGDAVNNAHLDKRLADFSDTAGPIAATVVETAGNFAGTVADNVGSFIKDNKLDKKASNVAGNVADNANSLLSLAGDKASQTLKDARLDKRLADAQLPEKLFGAANIIPGVTVSNPKKAAKNFRKRRKQVLKAAGKQQKELGKVLTIKQKEAGKLLQSSSKDAQKYISARRKDIETGKISIPFYEPPEKKGFNWGRTGLIIGGAGAVAGGLAANNARIWAAIPPLESKLPGENRYFRSRQGIVFYKESGESSEGKLPVVFVHGIGAGNTSYEWLQNFGPVSEEYKTYAYDLLGFGNSDRPGIKYTAEVYIKQLTEFLDEVVKQPAYVVASSLAASYAVQVAYRRPELVHKLVLASPTGINRVAGNNGVQILPPYLYFLLRTPIIGRSIYSGVASHKYIRSYMETQMFFDKSQVSDEMVEQYHVSAHQPGAEYAAFSFFTGLLNAEIGQTLGRVDKPVLIIQGKQDKQTSTEVGETLRRQNQSASLVNLEGARLLPHWEKASEFNKAVLNFLGQPDKPANKKLSASDKIGVAAGGTGSERKSHEEADGTTEKLTGKVEEMAGKVQDTVSQAAVTVQDKAGEVADTVQEIASKAGSKAQAKAGEDNDQLQNNADEAGNNVEKAAKKLSSKFVDQAKQEHAESDQQLGTSEQADKPKIKPLKSQAKNAGDEGSEQQASNKADAPEAAEYHEEIDLEKELKEHREAFIGDAESGAALLEDKDNDGVDDRRMGNRN